MYKLIAFDSGNVLGYGVSESPIFIVENAQLILLNALETSKVVWKEEEQMNSSSSAPQTCQLQPATCKLWRDI